MFISSIGAPQSKSSLLILRFSSKSTPFAGKVSNDEAPPEIRKTTWSSFVEFLANSKISIDVNIGNFDLTRAAGGFGGTTQNTHVYLIFTFNA